MFRFSAPPLFVAYDSCKQDLSSLFVSNTCFQIFNAPRNWGLPLERLRHLEWFENESTFGRLLFLSSKRPICHSVVTPLNCKGKKKYIVIWRCGAKLRGKKDKSVRSVCKKTLHAFDFPSSIQDRNKKKWRRRRYDLLFFGFLTKPCKYYLATCSTCHVEPVVLHWKASRSLSAVHQAPTINYFHRLSPAL